ncbi:MAG: hypothetical protein A2W00_01755 [Candidatus Eisenbacteria bacterium RBG_16_71_46]|nr:MAG: hypothetical protein A2W00_01755 [Candidatus Eisenbacteria bacterium RBG_16_71_46]
MVTGLLVRWPPSSLEFGSAAALMLVLFVESSALAGTVPQPAGSPQPHPRTTPALHVAFPDTMKVSLVEPDTIPVRLPKRPLEPPWALIGVVVGFGLAEGSRWLQGWRRRRRLIRALHDECRSLLSQLPDFIDICQQMIGSLRNHRFLPGPAVRAMRTVYDATITELTPHLSSRERNLLHVVHERLKVGDVMIADHGRDFLEELRHQQIADPWGAWINRFEEQIGSYQLVERLLQSFIAGNPVDVFHLQDPGDAGGAAARATALSPILPPTHDVARHFLRIVEQARRALHGIDLKIGNTGAFGVVGPRGLRPDLQSLHGAIEEFKSSKARMVELRQPTLEKKLTDVFADVERQYRDADRQVSPYERPDVGPGVAAHHFRPLAESTRSHVARLDAVKAELEKLTR